MHISNIKKSFSIVSIALIIFSYILTSGVLLFNPRAAHAATYTVTNTADSGAGSLRQAIIDANASGGADVIDFSIAGAGPHTLTPASAYPNITEAVTIDGFTEPDATANSAAAPLGLNAIYSVEIDASAYSNNIFATTSSGGSTTIRGLVMNGTNNAITINSSNNTITGNYLGTNVAGTVADGFANQAIMINTGTGNIIGGTSPADRNLISGNYSAIRINSDSSDSNIVAGNIIGLNAAGTAAIPNSRGIDIDDGPDSNIIGGTTTSSTNVISGNDGSGIYVRLADTTSNTISGNYIGIASNGTTTIGNAGHGVEVIQGATNTAIGGDTAGERNIISGNGNNGITIGSSSTTGTIVKGNYIGTNAAGTSDAGNSDHGILAYDSAPAVTIGGSASGEGNIISGNDGDGIILVNGGDLSTIIGNTIGLDVTGTADLGNSSDGIALSGVDGIIVGGDTAGERNVISGNDGDGIQIDTADSNTASGNYIGTDETGTADLGNTSYGVRIHDSDTNTIGGSTSDTRNVISGNNTSGVQISGTSSANTISGNFIGTNASGASAITNTTYGVHIVDTATSNTIGGTTGVTLGGSCTGACNVISGNTNNHGLFLQGSGGNTIAGNFVGLDVTGLVDVGNGGSGIHDAASGSNTIGGTSAGSRNVASGNGSMGIELQGDSTIVQGNYVGLNTDGSGVLPNDGGSSAAQVFIGGDNIQFGGTTTSARNIVSGSANNGIRIIGLSAFGGSSAENNKIQGNCIGTNANCQVETGFGFAEGGIGIAGDAVNTLVGGTESGAGNIIAGNGYGIGNLQLEIPGPGPFPIPGVYQPINNSFVGNSIYQNTGGTLSTIGIDNAQSVGFVIFSEQNVTPNDAGDIDADGDNTGPNHYLNFPEISSVTSTNGTATITYNLDINDTEAGATGYRVEFFANDSADPSGNGQGQTYLGSDTIPAADVTGRQATITLPAGVEGNKFISAVTTMTDASADGFGHSSEFAADVEATLVTTGSNPTANILATTGRNIKWIALVAALLLAMGGLGLYVAKRQQRTKVK